MRILLLLIAFSYSIGVYSQRTEAICNIIDQVDEHRLANTLIKMKGEGYNDNGTQKTESLPARFVEGHFRKLGDDYASIEYMTYAKQKQIEKIWKITLEEIQMCHPELVMEVGEDNTEEYQMYFFCDSSEVGGNQFVRDYKKMAFQVKVIHAPNEQSQLMIKLQ